MLIRIIKLTAIAALLGGIFWRPFADHRTLVQLVVSAEAIVICVQAARIRDYLVMSIFLVTACVFNPVVPLGFPNEIWVVVSTITAILFITSPEILKDQSRSFVPPIADRPPESEPS